MGEGAVHLPKILVLTASSSPRNCDSHVWGLLALGQARLRCFKKRSITGVSKRKRRRLLATARGSVLYD